MMKSKGCWSLGWLGAVAVWPLLAAGEVVYKPLPEDTPKAVAGGQTLAGDSRPDIVRFLKVRRATQPDISPDGKHVSYLTSTTGQPQLWVSEVEGGEARQLTFLESSVTFQSWSPAGIWIAYGTDLEGNEREGFYLISPDGFEERAILPPSDSFRVWGGWSPDGNRIAFASTERNGLDFDIYTVEVGEHGATSQPVMVHEGKGGLYVMGWSKDGKSIVLAQARGEADNDLYLLDVESRKLATLFRPDDGASHEGVSWTEDGFYLATNQDRDLAGLAFYNVETREFSWKETPDWEVERPALSGDARHLAWTVNENGYSVLRVEDLETGKRFEIAGLPRGTYTIRWARNRPVLMIGVASPRVPGDVWIYEPGQTARRVTRSATAGLRPESFVEPEPVSFESWDGERIHGLLYLPAGEGAGKRPVLIHVHGGPTAQSRPGFSPELQFFLTRGVAILDLNYRGSTGYGKRYTRLDNQRLRMDGVKDVGAAVDWLKGRSDVDGSRVAIMGASYGGFLTCAAVTEFPDKFRAGINIVGVCNWIRALEEASPQLKASDVIEYGDISDPDDRAYFESISPIRKADRITAAMMVLHGANDPRVPVGEADELVATIREGGGEAQYLRFPDEGHGFRKLSNQIIAYRRIAEFLEEKLLK